MQCLNRNNFCYVCGLYTGTKHKRNITKSLIKHFENYFVIAYVPNLWYTPEVVCDYCHRNLFGMQNESDHFNYKYVLPAIWLVRSEHDIETCYFCSTQPKTIGFHYDDREKIDYADVESVMTAKERSSQLPHAQSELNPTTFDSAADFEMGGPSTSGENRLLSPTLSHLSNVRSENLSEFVPTASELGYVYDTPHFITQKDFEDIVRDCKLPNDKAEIIASRLKQWKLVTDDFRVTDLRKRKQTQSFDELFQTDDATKISYCTNINELFKQLCYVHIPNDWRLFIDSSVESLKCVLLHIGNKMPSVPIAYSTACKETYETMQNLLRLVQYESFHWKICCDLKVVSLLTGVKKGFSKHQCFLCNWEGRDREKHYISFKWKNRVTYQIGVDSIDQIPLVRPSNVILPPLHIKLGIFRNFVRALDRNGAAFNELKNVFPNLTQSKIDNGK